MLKLRWKLASAVFSVVAICGAPPVHAQDVSTDQTERKPDAQETARAGDNPLLGTWKLQSFTMFGDRPNGYLSYSPDGRMYAIIVEGDRLKPRAAIPTDLEKLYLQGSMYAYAGTYTVDGDKVIHHVDISWNQSWTGTDQVQFYKLDGDILTLTNADSGAILVWKKLQ
jgi:Lipocalin-like domain